MADVMGRTDGGRDRGQMLLVAAFGVAVMLVALALILNTAIYTENVATRGSDISGGKDAQRYRAVTEGTLQETVQNVNANNNTSTGDYTPLLEPTRHAIWNYSNMSGRQQSVDSIVANLSMKPDAPSEGTHVFQRQDLNFSNEAGTTDWTVASNAQGVRRFRINATEAGMLTSLSAGGASTGSGVFFVRLSSSSPSEEYRIYVYDDSGVSNGFVVQVQDGSGTNLGTCTRTYENFDVDRARVNLTAATAAGSPCEPLQEWWSIVDQEFTMEFENTCFDTSASSLLACTDSASDPTIEGRFNFIVNSSINATAVDAGTGTTAIDNPNATTAVYSTNVRLTYESKRLYFTTDVRVAPGEPDA